MNNYYSSEENVLQLIALMKAHKVRKVVASPGTTNITFVGSLQNDSYFQVYSCVDERSAAEIPDAAERLHGQIGTSSRSNRNAFTE